MIWSIFILVILLLLGFDLLVLHEKGKVVTYRKAAIETAFWTILALSFSGVV